jgi:hypothetical protein
MVRNWTGGGNVSFVENGSFIDLQLNDSNGGIAACGGRVN